MIRKGTRHSREMISKPRHRDKKMAGREEQACRRQGRDDRNRHKAEQGDDKQVQAHRWQGEGRDESARDE